MGIPQPPQDMWNRPPVSQPPGRGRGRSLELSRNAQLATALAAVVIVAAVAFLLTRNGSSSNQATPPAPVNGQTGQASQTLTDADAYYLGLDIHSVLKAEGSYYSKHKTFTDSDRALQQSGMTGVAGIAAMLSVGSDHDNGFCVIADLNNQPPFALYDSEAGGLVGEPFPTQAAAEASCRGVTGITTYTTLHNFPVRPASPPAGAPSIALGVLGQQGINNERAAAVQSDLRFLATAEESVLVDTLRYTTSSPALHKEGYRPGDSHSQVFAGVHSQKGYCLVGSPSSHGPWSLYDSEHGGLNRTSFSSAKAAERACTDPAIKRFRKIS